MLLVSQLVAMLKIVIIWLSDRMTEWSSDQLTKWQSDQVTGWQEASQTIDRMVYFILFGVQYSIL